MACDHLDKKTFDNAMEEIKSNRNNMYATYRDTLSSSMSQLYEGWQSSKGYNKINTLYKSLEKAMDTADASICKNYTTMKTGGEAYAKSQDMFIIIGSINEKEYESEKKTFGDDQEIIIDESKINQGAGNLTSALNKINSYISASEDLTSTDAKFGYYSTGDSNPRQTLHDAYTALRSAMDSALESFSKDLDQTIADDKAAREAALQQSVADSTSGLGDIFN